jgi:molybdopterin-binding protein
MAARSTSPAEFFRPIAANRPNVIRPLYPSRRPVRIAALPGHLLWWRRHALLRIAMRISARNQFKGKILEVKKGATTAHVRLEIAPGQVITSSITNEAVEELGLKAGGTAIAIIKASNVMIAVD